MEAMRELVRRWQGSSFMGCGASGPRYEAHGPERPGEPRAPRRDTLTFVDAADPEEGGLTVLEGRARALARVPRCVPATEMLFPMYVLPVETFLAMDRARPHQALLADGLLLEYSPGMDVVFVSHQWCAFAHPDPTAAQLRVLQAALRELQREPRELYGNFMPFPRQYTKQETARLARAYLWYDFFSVPQLITASEVSTADHRAAADAALGSAMADAINSIPAYVELSSYFVVVAPFVKHADTGELLGFRTWQQRGWCRMERMAWLLAPGDSRIVVVGPSISVDDPLHYLFAPPGQGSFSVEADKERIAPVVRQLLKVRMEAALAEESFSQYRQLRAMSGLFLAGLSRGAEASGDELVPAFLRAYGLRTIDELDEAGRSAVHYCAASGELAVLEALVAQRADVEARTTRGGETEWCLSGKGHTPLHLAVLFCQDGELVRYLLEQRADVNSTGGAFAHAPLNFCTYSGHLGIAKLLLDFGAELEARHWFTDTTCLMDACAHLQPGLVRLLLRERADVNASSKVFGITALHAAADFVSDVHTVQALLEARAAPDPLTRSRGIFTALLAVQGLPYRLGSRKPQHVWTFHYCERMTPLMLAASLGNLPVARCLLDSRADAAQRNRRGTSAAELAQQRGHGGLAEELTA